MAAGVGAVVVAAAVAEGCCSSFVSVGEAVGAREMLRCNGRRCRQTERRMSFFDRNRKELIEKGYDPARLPPGQYLTDRFPVLHVGDVPKYGAGEWNLSIDGL